MKMSSGKVRDESMWPLPVIVRPRGAREIIWVIALITIVVFALEIAGGAYSFCAIVAATVFTRPSQRTQVKVMICYFLIGLIWCSLSRGLMEYPKQLIDVIRWSSGTDQSIWSLLLRICIVLPYAEFALITVLSYDCRWVDRKRVDDRLWKRQTNRRKQALRNWHSQHFVNEVGN